MKKEDIRVFLESKETYKKVLKVLNKKVKSETKYNALSQEELSTNRDLNSVLEDQEEGFTPFLCGGSVSNILYHLLHGGEPTINDIDIFLKYDDEDVVFEKMTTMREEGEEYAFSYKQENGSHYKILSEEKDGIINNIKCWVRNTSPLTKPSNIMEEVSSPYGITTKPKMVHNEKYTNDDHVILNGFDLNCTKSGMDIDGEEIVYTEGFLNFLYDKQLKVVAPHTPLQTTIRLFKKIEDLNCYCNVELEMDFLVGAIGTGIRQTLGKITYDKYVKYKDKVDKYFLVEKLNESTISKVLESCKGIPSDIKNNIVSTFSYNIGYPPYHNLHGENLKLIRQELMGWLDSVNLWVFTPTQQRSFTQFNLLNTYVKYWELLNRDKTKSDLIKINTILDTEKVPLPTYEAPLTLTELLIGQNIKIDVFKSNMLIDGLLKDDKLYKSDFTKEHVDYVCGLIKSHPRVWWKLPKTNIQNIYSKVRELKSYANKKGQWVIGEFENWNCGGEFGGWATIETDYDFGDFKLMVKIKEKEMNKALVKPLNLSEFGYDCMELTSIMMLKSEGTMMGHCVGGYSNSIERGDSRIFHVEYDGIGSTLQILKTVNYGNPWELKKENGVKWKVSQHYGRYPERGNLTPTDNNKNIAKELVNFMNENYPMVEPHSKEKRLKEREQERQEQEIF